MNYIKKGDFIGIFAPASDFNKEEFLNGLENIKERGYIPVFNERLFESSNNYLMHDDVFRKRNLEELLKDEKIKVIVSARGGYGSIRTLEALDRKLLLSSDKLLVGFSDVTVFHIFMNRHSKITLHGPMVSAFSRNKNSTDFLFDMLEGNFNNYVYDLKGDSRVRLKGKLTGGNLTVITSLAGTKYFYDFKDKIVLMEDLNEPLYKIDRMVMQLKLSGFAPKAVILGQFLNCGNYDEILNIFKENFNNVNIFSNIDIGHKKSTLSIFFGVEATIKNSKLYIGL